MKALFQRNKVAWGLLGVLVVLGASFVLCKKWDVIFPKDEWTITQWGPREINSTFYSMYNPRRGLILVDGGWEGDDVFVRSVIELYGGEVDAWILTHPHQDHIGAFHAIYSDLQDVTVKEIYTVKMPSPEKCLEAAPWDSMEAYEDFLALDIPEINYVYEGDELTVCGLELKVYNAYGEAVEVRSKDYLNDGSMMFEVCGEEESFLFCADVGVAMSDYLLSAWGEELSADYLQMGHHGYGGLKDDFYQKVSPRISFFDAPAYMMQDTTGQYDNPEHVRLMEAMGSEIVSFHGGSYSIVLQ